MVIGEGLRDQLARRHAQATSERHKLMEACYANAIHVTMLRHYVPSSPWAVCPARQPRR